MTGHYHLHHELSPDFLKPAIVNMKVIFCSFQSKTVLMKCFLVDQPGEETSDNHGTF